MAPEIGEVVPAREGLRLWRGENPFLSIRIGEVVPAREGLRLFANQSIN